MVVELKFRIGGFFSGWKEVNIWIEDGVAFKSYSGDFADIDNVYTKEISDKEKVEFESRLKEVKVSRWKKKYVDLGVMDGTQWELEYKETLKRRRCISGSNAFPENWNQFIEALGCVIPEIVAEFI